MGIERDRNGGPPRESDQRAEARFQPPSDASVLRLCDYVRCRVPCLSRVGQQSDQLDQRGKRARSNEPDCRTGPSTPTRCASSSTHSRTISLTSCAAWRCQRRRGRVADQLAREANQDRRQDHKPRPLCHFPNGRNRGATVDVRRHPVADRPAAGTTCASMREQRDQMRQATTAKVCLDLAK